MIDFGTTAAKTLFESEVRKRQELFGMFREQAEMLVAALMWDGPKEGADESGDDKPGCGNKTLNLEKPKRHKSLEH